MEGSADPGEGTVVELALPAGIASAVLSTEDVRRTLVERGCAVYVTAPEHPVGPYRDLESVFLVVSGTVGAGAAGKGLFDMLGQILRQVHESSQLRRAHEHEVKMALLRVGTDRHELVHIYHRADPLDSALARLHGIGVDPEAGQSDRDAMLPEFSGLDQQLILPVRKALIDLLDRGAVAMQRVELPDHEPTHPRVLRILDMRWRAQNSPAGRAVCAALAHLEQEGLDLLTVRIGDRALGDRPPQHLVAWTLQRLNSLPEWIHESNGQWLHVVNPSRGKPMTALRFTDPTPGSLPTQTVRLVN